VSNDQRAPIASSRSAARVQPRAHKKSSQVILDPATTWVSSKVAKAILQIQTNHLSTLKQKREIRFLDGTEGGYNLFDILERYRKLLQAEGILQREIEASCIKEFAKGKVPQEVIIDLGFTWSDVKQAWVNWHDMQRDPEAIRVLEARKQTARVEVSTRCRGCERTPEIRQDDNLRVVREVTDDETRSSLSMDMERACADLNFRCPVCRTIKATAPIDTMRARIRKLKVMGPPQPVVLDPLPEIIPPGFVADANATADVIADKEPPP
jgi:hypothetical protein